MKSEVAHHKGRKVGRTLKLFLVDGSPTGVITAELGNWSGKAVVAPRTALPELIKREEASRTGVYLLMGADPGTTLHAPSSMSASATASARGSPVTMRTTPSSSSHASASSSPRTRT